MNVPGTQGPGRSEEIHSGISAMGKVKQGLHVKVGEETGGRCNRD